MVAPQEPPWDTFWKDLEAFYDAVRRYPAVNVNADSLRDDGRRLVQRYFREVRPELERLEVPKETLATVDAPMQTLLRLTAGRNNKRSYLATLRSARRLRPSVEAEREYGFAKASSAGRVIFGSKFESDLHGTLGRLVPTAASSYLQAIRDLADAERLSLRGTADELREALREVLDHLAPDDAVTHSPGFTLEKNRTKPTMKQKARFILKSRGIATGARESTEGAVDRVEEGTAALARSVYDRGSLASHVTMTRTEVMQLKRYVEAVLAELLQVH
jgi:hypothetical protein